MSLKIEQGSVVNFELKLHSKRRDRLRWLGGVALLALLGVNMTASGAEVMKEPSLVREQVVHEKTTDVNIELNSRTVLCSASDYQAEMLKIVIPKMSELTLLNHREINAGGPIVSAGVCRGPMHEGLAPEEILKPGLPEYEQIPMHVKLTRITSIYANRSECEVMLKEEVRVTVRGIPFYHVREAMLEPRVGADCL